MDQANGRDKETPRRKVALLVDGENISHALAGLIFMSALSHGDVIVMRVYGNATLLPGWDKAERFRLIHSGSGKNATDILLTVEAMALAYGGLVDCFCIASSDRDYTHLVQHLREKGHPVVGMGEAKAGESYRKAFVSWVELTPPASSVKEAKPGPGPKMVPRTLDEQITDILRQEGGSLAIHLLNARMRSAHDVKISKLPEKTWRAYLLARGDLFRCDPRGPDAKVRLGRAEAAAEEPRSAP